MFYVRIFLVLVLIGVPSHERHLAAQTPAVATLLLPDFCADPSAVFDYQWATLNNAKPGLVFYMNTDGSVLDVINTTPPAGFASIASLFVASHGTCTANGRIGTLSYSDFQNFLFAANPSNIKSLFLAACYSQGLAEMIRAVNPQIAVTYAQQAVGLKRINNDQAANLANAHYYDGVGLSPSCLPVQAQISEKWEKSAPVGQTQSYQALCNVALTQLTANPSDANALSTFIATVFQDFQSVYFSLMGCDFQPMSSFSP